MQGLVVYRRSDVLHERFYARIALEKKRKYKVVALGSAGMEAAIQEATKKYVETQFAVKNELVIFRRSFAQVAKEYLDTEKDRTGLSGKGGISFHRWRVMDNQTKNQLSRYIGAKHISQIGRDHWIGYAAWRQKNGKGRDGGRVSGATIRSEMTTLRAIMKFAALKGYVSELKTKDAFHGRYLVAHERRDAFTRTEYRILYMYMRKWVKEEGLSEISRWTRQMVRNFILIMCHTGMRNTEARNLRWSDIFEDRDRGRVIFNVSGKSKQRSFEATIRVSIYLARIRELSRKLESSDFVFSTYEGKRSQTLYVRTIADLLKKSALTIASSGKRRSTYSFRHSFATWRLQAGADVFSLARHMGTSVEMIQQSYGHVTTKDVADNVLRGLR